MLNVIIMIYVQKQLCVFRRIKRYSEQLNSAKDIVDSL
jgi:hypothetical protein